MNSPVTSASLGSSLLALKERSGLSLAQIAEAAGYRSASAIQRFFNVDYAPVRPSVTLGRRLASALGGRGAPPVETAEVLSLFADNAYARESYYHDHGLLEATDTIPMTSAALVTEGISDDTLSFLEVFTRKYSGTVIRTPPHLRRMSLAAFYVPTSNMHPKFEIGELAVFETSRPARVGDYAVVRLAREIDLRHVHFIARVEKIIRGEVAFNQLNPSLSFSAPTSAIDFMARIVTPEDLLPPIEAIQK